MRLERIGLQMVFSNPHIDSIQEVVVINNAELFAAKFSTKTVEESKRMFDANCNEACQTAHESR